MLFTQIEFFILLIITIGFAVAIKNHRVQKLLLLAASYYFYAYWDWRFLTLIAGCTAVNWIAALEIEKAKSPVRRKLWLSFALMVSLGGLGFFKYYNFFVSSLNALLDHWGWSIGTLRIVLPVGISFFTFQTLSYTIDVYRGQLRACRYLPDLALFIAFFPQLVAGPIVRASEFMPQLETRPVLRWTDAYEGIRLFVFGFFKKVFLADRLAFAVDVIFSHAGAFDGITVWLGLLAYAVQIYCDFSGYSDMAIGVARILGYRFSVNFNMPYVATNIQDFWRRWHISLSTWLRDYLYISLGGNRKGRGRTYANLLLTMLLGGLWHGASWAFVAWGGLHGLALAAHRLWTEMRGGQKISSNFNSRALGWFLTMTVVLGGWVFFRAGSFEQASVIFQRLLFMGDGVRWIHPFALGAVGVLAAHHILYHMLRRPVWLDLPISHWLTPGGLILLFGLSLQFYPTGFTPFIYFQF